MHVVVHNVPSNTPNPREASTLCAHATRTLQYVRNTTGPTRNAIDSIRAASAQTNSVASHRTWLRPPVALFRSECCCRSACLPGISVLFLATWMRSKWIRLGTAPVRHCIAAADIVLDAHTVRSSNIPRVLYESHERVVAAEEAVISQLMLCVQVDQNSAQAAVGARGRPDLCW